MLTLQGHLPLSNLRSRKKRNLEGEESVVETVDAADVVAVGEGVVGEVGDLAHEKITAKYSPMSVSLVLLHCAIYHGHNLIFLSTHLAHRLQGNTYWFTPNRARVVWW